LCLGLHQIFDPERLVEEFDCTQAQYNKKLVFPTAPQKRLNLLVNHDFTPFRSTSLHIPWG